MKKLIFLFLLVFLLACVPETPRVIIDDTVVHVELAISQEEREQGLMFRESLQDGAGMLFVMPEERQQYFWMKNTLIPLDIIFIDEKNSITQIHHALPCKEEPCILYGGMAKYVLEVPSGYAEKHAIKQGDNVVIEK